jgi:hypothetical protein
MLKIFIPKPCQEDWAAMTPNEQGRHCTSCAKTVVDFTSMNDEDVKNFFINKREEKVCGRFKNEQLHRIVIELPRNIFYIPMPGWKKFLVASLLVFSATLFSCDTNITGKAKVETEIPGGSITNIEPVKKQFDSLIQTKTCTSSLGVTQIEVILPITVGEIQPPYAVEQTIKGDTIFQDNTTMGTPAIIKAPEKMGDIEIPNPDSLKTKNPPKADSMNCDTQVYY